MKSMKRYSAYLILLIASSCAPTSNPGTSPGSDVGAAKDAPPTTGAARTCSIAKLDPAVQGCLPSRGADEFSKIQMRISLWAESTGDLTGRPGSFPAELLDLSAFRRKFEITDSESRCLNDRLCSTE